MTTGTQRLDGARARAYPLRRREVVRRLLELDEDLLVVAGLGAPAWDCTAAGDRALTFPLWGAMGGAAVMGLGLAIAQPERKVLVVTGDGEMLMGLGALATIGIQKPENLAIIVLDNERYGETGMQLTATAGDIDLPAMAGASGFATTRTIRSENEFGDAVAGLLTAPGPGFYSVKVRAEDLPLVMPPKDGVSLKDRFRVALLGASEALA